MENFIESQLEIWPEARERYLNLGKTERKKFQLGDFILFLQHNPARNISTSAKTDEKSISKRPCFLCKSNRPDLQVSIPLFDKWEMLLNPYPIFPVHFTIVSKNHEPQSHPPLEIMEIANKYPELAVFFNGALAGASAPDHLHLQAVLKDELPIIKLTEKFHSNIESGLKDSLSFNLNLPFVYFSAVIRPDKEGEKALFNLLGITGYTNDYKPNSGLRNVIFWKDNMGVMRGIVIPRKAHRPKCYGIQDGEMLISPGTIDMAGVVIAPRIKDYEKINEPILYQIFSDTGFSQEEFKEMNFFIG